jgi:hypothetical protein
MNELEAAYEVRDGNLPSPYVHENITLFALRVTGVGMAYRSSIDEFVWRDPELFLTDKFVSRVAGLPLIWEHPEAHKLDSEEFANRVIGSLMFGYIKDQEVWGIARVYDDLAIKLMSDGQLSTSPLVVFGPTDGNKTRIINDDELLIEGLPSTFCHLAVCAEGVWDKGQTPSGVQNDNLTEKEPAMADDKVKSEEKMDSEMPAWAKSFSDSMNARMDAFEKKDPKADAEEDEEDEEDEDFKKKSAKDDKAKADTTEEEERAVKKAEADSKAKADAGKDMETAYADSVKRFETEIAALKAQMPRDLSDDDRNAIAVAKSRADSAYGAVGKNAPHEMLGETPLAYRRRLAVGLQTHSKDWNGIPLRDLPEAAFNNAETSIYADAAAYSRSPQDLPANELREIKSVTPHGHRVSTYVGSPSAWMSAFGPAVHMRARFIRTEGKR